MPRRCWNTPGRGNRRLVLMQGKSKPRRPRGTGNLYARRDTAGRETWYGRFYVGGRRGKRRWGPRRVIGPRDGMTPSRAGAERRRLMQETRSAPATSHERLTVEEAGRRCVDQLEALG